MNERLLALRKALDLTLAELGKKLQLSPQSLSMMETGKRPIVERTISSILAAYPQVSEQWFRTGEGEMFRSKKIDPELDAILAKLDLPEITERCVRIYDAMPAEDKKRIDAYLQKVIADLMEEYQQEQADKDTKLEEEIRKAQEMLAVEMRLQHKTESNLSTGTL